MGLRKLLAYSLLVAMCISIGSVFSTAIAGDAFPVEIQAEAAMVLDLDHGQILYDQYADKQFSARVLSKLMTALIAVETLPAGSSVTASINAAAASDPQITITAGSIYKLEDLLSASILTLSDNACIALYEAIEQDADKFTALMNAKAASLSLSNTLFTTPLGKEDTVSYTTVRDLALFMQYAFNIQAYKDIFCSPVRWSSDLTDNGIIRNSNDMFWDYYYTNYTKGGILLDLGDQRVSAITYATRRNMNLLTITISTPSSSYIKDISKLFDHCFMGFEKRTLVQKDQNLKTITVAGESLSLLATNEVSYIAPIGSSYIQSEQALLLEEIKAPIETGAYMGTIKYTLEDGTIITVPVQAGNTIYSNSATLNDIIITLTSNKDILTLILALCGFEVLLGIFYITKVISRKRAKHIK